MSESLTRDAWHAVTNLTEPNTAISRTGQPNPPLLEMLARAVTNRTGTEGTGAHAHGIRLNHNAVELLSRINHTLRKWATALKVPPMQSNGYILNRAMREWEAQYLRGEVTTQFWEKQCHRVIGWANQITDIWDGYSPTPARGPCPNCGTRWIYADNARKEAVIIYTHPYRTPYAECGECEAITTPPLHV